jgi:hypothetical protein
LSEDSGVLFTNKKIEIIGASPAYFSEIGNTLPIGTFQILGITGCVCLGIPQYNLVAVRMYNQKGPNPKEYDYLKDIKTWGDLVLECAGVS